jgi:predicted ATPase
VLKKEISLQPSEFVIHYFNENFESEKLIVDDKGKIKNWPSGFFDQEEIDLANIFKFGSKA